MSAIHSSSVAQPHMLLNVGEASNKGKGKQAPAANVKAAESKQPTKTVKASAAASKGAQKKQNAKGKASAAAAAEKQERHYGMDPAKAKELKAAKAYNGYREGSSYWTVVEALHSLGSNKFHALDKLIAAYVKEADKEALKHFKGKESRTENGLDWKGKIATNAYTCTRSDYGKRMRDIGWEVRQQRDANGEQQFGLFRLGK